MAALVLAEARSPCGVLLQVVRGVGSRGASVVASRGGTVVHASCVSSAMDSGGLGGAPLSVEYREHAAAAGRIPRTFTGREFRPKEPEVLAGRAVDRALRPLMAPGFAQPTQVTCSVRSADGTCDPEILAINAGSAAMHLAGVPWHGPVAAARTSVVGKQDGREDGDEARVQVLGASLGLTVAGVARDRVVMLELCAEEAADAEIVAAIRGAGEEVEGLVEAQHALKKQVEAKMGPPSRPAGESFRLPSEAEREAAQSTRALAARLAEGSGVGKRERAASQTAFWSEAMQVARDALGPQATAATADETMLQEAVHDELRAAIARAAQRGVRPDGRALDEVRPLRATAGLLPRAHGSALFSRGDTQVVCLAALGAPADAQRAFPTLHPPSLKRVQVNYAFPPYCVNRTGKVFGTNRRTVGHGRLAERALLPALGAALERSNLAAAAEGDMGPALEGGAGASLPLYPFTVNVTAEVTASDGSSSMASVCGASLALLDACVPLARPVAGVSVGLFVDPDDPARFVLPVDILGMEDHFGGMDMKVAGTTEGVTALQLDIKRPFVTVEVIEAALARAGRARAAILDDMLALAFPGGPPTSKSELPVFARMALRSPRELETLHRSHGLLRRQVELAHGVQLHVALEGADEASPGTLELFGPSHAALQAALVQVEAAFAEVARR